jgi:O-methyltransferase involved in polyketide biosynthesis
MKINLSGVSNTLLLPLYARAFYHDYYPDPKAVELVNKIEYDFEGLREQTADSILFCIARTITFDYEIRMYLKRHPLSTIVDIGCGLDTGFYRNDNGAMYWNDVDLPQVIITKFNLMKEHQRVYLFGHNLLVPKSEELIKVNAARHIRSNDHLFLAGGLFLYWDPEQVKRFIVGLANRFAGSELLFDCSPNYVISEMQKHVADKNLDFVFKFGLDEPMELESWSPNIKIVSINPYFDMLLKHEKFPENEKLRATHYAKENHSKIIHLKFI